MRVLSVAPVQHSWSDQGGLASRARPSSAPVSASLPKKVPSLIFELEEETARDGVDARDLDCQPQAVGLLAQLVELKTDLERLILSRWRAVSTPTAPPAEQLSMLASRLQHDGFGEASVQTALGGGGGGACLRNLRHTFLAYSHSGFLRGEAGIFDPAFRDQFTVLNPSPAYERLLDFVPVAFVGSRERLEAAVRLLCREMQAEFEAKGSALPPWRDVQAMLTKWRAQHPHSKAALQARPASRAPAFTAHQTPSHVSRDFAPGAGCQAMLSMQSSRGAKLDTVNEESGAGNGRALYRRLSATAAPMLEGFQRVNRSASNLLGSAL